MQSKGRRLSLQNRNKKKGRENKMAKLGINQTSGQTTNRNQKK